MASTSDANLRSQDGGTTFTAVTAGAAPLVLLDELDGNILARDDSNNLFLSTDDAAHFELQPTLSLPGNWLRMETKQRWWSATRDSGTTDYRVSEDGGVTWAPLLGGSPTPVLFDSQRVAFTLNPLGVSRVNPATGQFEAALTWATARKSDFGASLLAVQQGTVVFFWVGNDENQTLYRTEEPFDTVTPVGKLPGALISLSQDSAQNLVITTKDGVYFSRDDGASWIARKSGLGIFTGQILGTTQTDKLVLVPGVSNGPFFVSPSTSNW